MTPEEIFNQDIWWILQEIKQELLYSNKNEIDKVEFSLRPQINNRASPADVQRKLLYKLKEWKAIGLRQSLTEALPEMINKINKDLDDNSVPNFKLPLPPEPPTRYALTIFQPKFDEVYKKYSLLFSKPDEAIHSKATITPEVLVSDLQSRYTEIQNEKNDNIFYLKVANYGKYLNDSELSTPILNQLFQESQNQIATLKSYWREFFEVWKDYSQDLIAKENKLGHLY